MKIIDLAIEGTTLDELLAIAADENVVVRTSDGREFVVAELDDFDQEVALIRGNSELMALLDSRSLDKTTYTPDEVKRQLGLE
jgi:hypothetical protein